jgi:hypothetical protein
MNKAFLTFSLMIASLGMGSIYCNASEYDAKALEQAMTQAGNSYLESIGSSATLEHLNVMELLRTNAEYRRTQNPQPGDNTACCKDPAYFQVCAVYPDFDCNPGPAAGGGQG